MSIHLRPVMSRTFRRPARRPIARALAEMLERRQLLSVSLGVPDPTFSGGTTFGPGGFVQGLIVLPDQRILQLTNGVTKYTADGRIDTSFAGDGTADTPISENAMAVQGDGRIVVVGGANAGSGGDDYAFAVTRLNANGSLDTSFGANGVVTLPYGDIATSQQYFANKVEITTDGKIVVTGWNSAPGGTTWHGQMLVARLNPNGSLDTSFSGDGLAYIQTSDAEGANGYSLALAPGGKIVVSGVNMRANMPVLARLNGDGSLDTSFGNGGVVEPTFQFGVTDVAARPNGQVIALSHDGPVLFNLDGSVDGSYGSGGVARLGQDRSVHHYYDLQVAGDGDLLVTGEEVVSSVGYQAVIYRLNPDGSRDMAFGQSGRYSPPWSESETGSRIALQGNKILLSGYSAPQSVAVAALSRLFETGGATNLNGLLGTYFRRSLHFPEPFLQRVDPTINFDWGAGSPDPRVPTDGFGVRWIGQIDIPQTGRYTFTARGDDRARLFIDGQQVVNHIPGQTPYTGSIDLTAGRHDIRYEYEEFAGSARTTLQWAGPGITGTQVVPANRLFPGEFDDTSSSDTSPPSAVPNFRATTITPDSILLEYGSATDNVGVAMQRVFQDGEFIGGSSGSGSVRATNLQPDTSYTFSIIAYDAAGNAGPATTLTARTLPASSGNQTPIKGSPFSPNAIIEGEDFDNGGQNVSFFDNTTPNEGGAYRSTAVDLYAVGGVSNGHVVGLTRPSEWLEYTVNVAESGTYSFDTRYATPATTAQYRYEIDGTNVTGTLNFNRTGSYSTYATARTPTFNLSAGTHVIRLFIGNTTAVGTAANIDWLRLNRHASTPTTQTPFHGTPFAVNATIQAEDFDKGGQGVAFSDADSTNKGGKYRLTERVDLETTGDTGGGFNVGYTAANEWIEYTITIPAAGNYDIQTRLAAVQHGQISYAVDGVRRAVVGVMPTAGFQSYTTVTHHLGTLSAGTHVLRLQFESTNGARGIANVNWLRIVPASVPPADTQAPTAVPNIQVIDGETLGSVYARVTWSGARDNVGIAGYRITYTSTGDFDEDGDYSDTRSDTVTLGPESRSFQTGTPSPGSVGNFRVVAFDAAGNVSPATSAPAVPAGVTATFYNNSDFTSPSFSRIDPTINFDWGAGSPDSRIDSDTFSVRWTGQIVSDSPAARTFWVPEGERARLIVNGETIIDYIPGQTSNSGTAHHLSWGRYTIVYELMEQTGNSSARLEWNDTGTRAVIPTEKLISD